MNAITPIGNPAQLKVIGVGNGGCKVLNHLVEEEIQDVDIIAVDTDSQTLLNSKAHKRLVIGDDLTGGRGTDGDPNVGQMSAEESNEELEKVIKDSDLVFIVTGLGGGTGSSVASVIASLAHKYGALVIGIVTTPFQFEGRSRMRVAENGLNRLQANVDALVVVSEESLLSKQESGLFLDRAFNLFADMTYRLIIGITDLLLVPGLINLDFADIRTIVSGGALSSMAFGSAFGEDRAVSVVNNAMSNAMGNLKIENAKGILFNITGGSDMTLFEVTQAAAVIREMAGPDINMIFGAIINPKINDELYITILATNNEMVTLSSDEYFTTPLPKRPLKVFLCHSSSDKPIVRKLYQRLYSKKGIDPWLDEAKLLPGERWNYEITRAVKEADVVIVCLSRNAINREGYVQKEIKHALDVADEKPEGTIFIIPLKLEDCDVPDRLKDWQWVNYYEEGAFDRVMQSLHKRAEAMGIVK